MQTLTLSILLIAVGALAACCKKENKPLYNAFMANPKFTFALMMFYSRELRKVENRIKHIAQMNTREKVAEALLYLIEIFGIDDQKELNVSLSREDIAGIAGTNADQITRQLTDFEKEKLIVKKGKKYYTKSGRIKKNYQRF